MAKLSPEQMAKLSLELKAKLEEILKDRDTKQWLITLTSESVQTNYPKHLAEYLLYRNQSVSQMIKNFKKDQSTESKRLQEFVNYMINNRELASTTVANYASAVKNRLEYDDIQITRRIRIKDRHIHHSVENEVVPRKEQILQFLQLAKPETQAIIALMAFLGVRFNVIGDLRVKDFLEMRIDGQEVIFEKMPTRINIRQTDNKSKHEYTTFLIETGCQIIKNSLELRLKRGEKLEPDSFIIKTDCKKDSRRQRANVVARRVYTVFDKIKLKARPYSIKDFFATALANTGIQQNYQTYFMGYKGYVQNIYSTNRKQPAEQIEFMRNLFKKNIEPQLVPQPNSNEARLREVWQQFGKQIGIEVKADASTEETIAEIAEVYKAGQEDLLNRENNVQRKQKRIKEAELDGYLDDDWELQTTLPSGDLVIKKVIYN